MVIISGVLISVYTCVNSNFIFKIKVNETKMSVKVRCIVLSVWKDLEVPQDGRRDQY
jgi:hypothetical protein